MTLALTDDPASVSVFMSMMTREKKYNVRQFIDYLRQFGRFQRNAGLYLLQSTQVGIALGLFILLYPLYLLALGYKTDLIGLMLFFTPLGTGVAIMPAGLCVDRISHKAILIWSSVLIIIAVVGQILFRGLVLLCTSAFVVGIGLSFQFVLNAPFLLTNSTDDERAHLFSFNIVLTLATTVIGQVLGGALPTWLRQYPWAMFPHLHELLASQPLARSYQIALLCGVLIALTSFLPLILMTADLPSHGRSGQQPFWLALLLRCKIWHSLDKHFKKDKIIQRDVTVEATTLSFWQRMRQFPLSPLATMTGAYVLMAFGAGILFPYFGLFFVEHLGANATLFGIVSGTANAILAFATLLAPWMVMRIGRLKTIVFTSLLALPVLLCIGIFPFLLLAVILYPLFWSLWGMSSGIIQLFGMEVVPPKLHGQANSSYQVALQGASAAATPIGGLLINRLGYTSVFSITAVFFLLSLVLMWWRFADKRFVSSEASQGISETHDQEPSKGFSGTT